MRALKALTLLCLAVIMVAGCDRSPSNETLATDITAYVDSVYAPGLVEVVHAERLDHRVIPDFNNDRREVSFVAEIRLRRDYDFGAWDQANAAALMLLLDARPEMVRGLTPGGNKAGDTIHITGHVLYVRGDRGWRLEANAASRAEPAERPGRLELLRDWRQITMLAARALVSPQGTFPEDLSAALKTAQARLARRNGGLAIASGENGGDYWNVAQVLARSAPAKNAGADTASPPSAINVATRGARENLRLLRDGVVTAALLRSDEAALAARGEGPFADDGTFPILRAVASLFPEQIHVVVLGASPVASVADLYGKRVAVVAGGPAALVEAGDVLRAHRVALSALASVPQELTITDALAALRRGEHDAVILTSSAPSAALRDFAVSNAVRFLPLDADAVALMTSGNSNYIAVTVPAHTYPGQRRPVATVGVTALLVSTTQIADTEIETLLQRTFAGRDFMSAGSPFGGMIKASTAQRGLTLPLHSGAEAFFGASAAPK
jgi:TRAP transporter TAXI family solute receptor